MCFYGDSKSHPVDKIIHSKKSESTSWIGMKIKGKILSSVVRTLWEL